MRRRDLFIPMSLAPMALAAMIRPSLGLAQEDPVAAAFASMSAQARVAIQQELVTGGFHAGAVDGVFGPATQAALWAAAVFVAENSGGRLVADLTTRDGAGLFLMQLASGEAARWLYGEGNESDF